MASFEVVILTTSKLLTNLVDFVKQDLCIDGNPLGDALERVWA